MLAYTEKLESVAKSSVMAALRYFMDAEHFEATCENFVTMATGVGWGPV